MTRSGLAEYLVQRYTAWKRNRERLDTKWQNDLNMMRREDPVDRDTFKKGEGTDWRSTDYIGLAKAKVVTVFSILSQTILAQGKVPFALKPSPYQIDFMQGQDEMLDEMVDKMEDRIREQQADRHADREKMKQMLSLLIYGMTVSKYNIEPVERSGYRQMDFGVGPEIAPYMGEEAIRFEEFRQTDAVPGHIYRSVWNMFWDMESPGSFQTIDGYCERELISVQDLRAKKGKPFYIDDAIDRAISQKKENTVAEDATSLPPGQREIHNRKKVIRSLEFWCRAPIPLVKQALEDIGRGQGSTYGTDLSIDYMGTESDADETEILCEMADDEIVRLAINDSGKRPHREAYWEVMLDEAGGETVSDNMAGVQYLFNGILRGAMDNYRLASNVILALKRRYFEDQSQLDKPIQPGMTLDVTDACDDARKAMQQVIIQDVSQSAIPWLAQLWQWKDAVSNTPDILQGNILPQQGGDTAYEWSQRLDFGSKYIGLGIRNFDEMIIEPEITDLYQYNMRDPGYKGPKGDYICHATGYASFNDKLLQTQKLKEILGMMLTSEVLGIYAKIRPHIEQIYRNLDLDPDEFLRTEEEVQQMQQQQAEQQQQMLEAQANLKAQDSQAKLQTEVVKKKMDQETKEQDFQRDLIKEGIKKFGNAGKPAPQERK